MAAGELSSATVCTAVAAAISMSTVMTLRMRRIVSKLPPVADV
jgi:hypothetical protein